MTTWDGENPPTGPGRRPLSPFDRLFLASLIASWLGCSVLIGSVVWALVSR